MRDKKGKNSVACMLSILAVALVLCGCGAREKENLTVNGKIRVEVEPVVRGDISETIKLTGEVAPFSTVILTSKVPGRLERLAIKNKDGIYEAVAEGVRVRKGQQLAVVDLATYTAHTRQAEAAVASAKAQFEDAMREEKRMTSLFKEGVVTEQMRDKSVTARARSEAALKQAEAALDLARINLDEATPESPIDGIVVAKHMDEGNIVSPGMPIVTIQDMSKMKVIFSLPERYLPRVVSGKTRVKISSDALEGEPINGVVSTVYPSVDRATRTTKIEILVNNSDKRLRPGMFARVTLEYERTGNIPVVPEAALLRQGEKVFAFVVEGSKTFRRPVKLGLTQKDRHEVKEGLQEGDLVVVRGQHTLSDGDEIEITRENAE